ncbi:hypothetical protein GGI35DRAFT_102139 [Trichoderma velutinum]
MIYGDGLELLRKGWKLFLYPCSMGNNGGRFIFSTLITLIFLHCIVACRQMHARYISELECLVFFAIICPAFLYVTNWLELDWVFYLLFLLLSVFFFFAFFYYHEIAYGVVCLYGAWSMEHMGFRGDD